MRRVLSCNVAGLAVLGFLTAVGCSSKPQLAEVEGTIKLDGKPLADIEVQFVPDSEKGTKGQSIATATDKNGYYKISTAEKGAGVVVGHNRVVLVDPLSLPPIPNDRSAAKHRVPQPSRIPENYTSVHATPLRKEVKAGSQKIDLEVTK